MRRNYERNPLFKGACGMVINSLIYNPGPRAVHYNLIPENGTAANMNWATHAIGNAAVAHRPRRICALHAWWLRRHRDLTKKTTSRSIERQPLPKTGRYTTSAAKILPMAKPAANGARADTRSKWKSRSGMQARARGSRPIDARIVADTVEDAARSSITKIVGGYPHTKKRAKPS
jgi:hypothetical protein